jgi:uncharacterized membrane protein/thiol-disulfide isomerase/thioredoxin
MRQKVKRLSIVLSVLILGGLLGAWPDGAAAQDSEPVVHAVLFYSPTCGHCEYVIKEVLPPLYEKYGPQLQIIGFDVSTPQGQAMFTGALEYFGVEEGGVPFLVIDDIVLVGSQQIPEELPTLVDAYLRMGGVDWPGIPGLREMLISAAQTATAEARPGAEQTVATPATDAGSFPTDQMTWQRRFAADAAANTIAVILLAAMVAGVVWGVIRFRQGTDTGFTRGSNAWMIPALCVVGLAVAGYLAYVEATGVEATCGPIGDCNTVQQSPYSHLFGVLSIGVFGLIGYVTMITAWGLARLAGGRTAQGAAVGLFLLALLGTVFSIYLTFLEPFVIGATCAWCLTSAVLMTVLMLLSAGAAGSAWLQLRSGTRPRSRRPRPTGTR